MVDNSQPGAGQSSESPSHPDAKNLKEQRGSDTDEEDEEEPSPCGRCRKMVVRGDEALMCEICSRWFHIKCEKITKAQYKNQSSKTKSNFHWFCDGCDIVQSGLIREMTLLKVDQTKINKRLEELEANKVNKEDLQEEMDKKADKENVQKLEQRIDNMEGKHAASVVSGSVNEGASCSKSQEEYTEEVIKEIKEQEERMPNLLFFQLT